MNLRRMIFRICDGYPDEIKAFEFGKVDPSVHPVFDFCVCLERCAVHTDKHAENSEIIVNAKSYSEDYYDLSGLLTTLPKWGRKHRCQWIGRPDPHGCR